MTKTISERLGASPTLIRESATKGVWEIKIIEAGEGSSGYYPAEVLERDGAKAFPKGTRMFANHDGWEDMMNGGDIRRLMGKSLKDATYRDGALWTEAKFAADWIPWVDEFHEQVGVSINTAGASEFGTIGEYSGDIITALENDPYTSVDVVVAPGAGGKFVRMLESAQRIVETGKKSVEASADIMKENQVELKDIKEALAESNKALVDALIEALKPAAPVEGEVDFAAVAEAVVAEESLTPAVRGRIFEAVKNGEKVADAIASEKKIADEYKAKFAEAQTVSALGVGRVVEGKTEEPSIAGYAGIKVGA